jgi:hypothetical protein
MTRGRRPPLTLTLAALLALALLGCYDVPKPECGFRCGPSGACPEDYTCSPSDGRCHLNGSPSSLVCGAGEAPADAAVDGGGDAAVDAAIDAMVR